MTNTDFEDRKSTIRAELQERARARATITYGEAAAMVGLAHQGLSGILNAIKDEEAEQERPDLGCLVVGASTGFPSYVTRDKADRERALSVRKAVFAAWRSRPEALDPTILPTVPRGAPDGSSEA